MRFRLKAKYYSGFTDKARTRYDPNMPIVQGCWKAGQRRKLNRSASTISTEALNAEAQIALKGAKSSAPVCLQMKLRHGDIMVMNGVDLQKFFEVNPVIPQSQSLALTTLSMRSNPVTSSALH